MDEEADVLRSADPPAVDPAPQDAPANADGPGEREGSDPACPDPAPGVPPLEPAPPADLPDPQELGRLREELTHLREEVASAREAFLQKEADYAEFRALFPAVPLASLPDAVWEDVRRGIPLPAAVALSERRRALTEQAAEAANSANRERACGNVRGETAGYLSARDVRAMSPEEVREHYEQILRSMPRWDRSHN